MNIGWILLSAALASEGRTAAREEALRTEMSDHWTEATRARDALIAGALRRATRMAARIEPDLPYAGVREELHPMRLGVVAAASRAAEAGDLSTAASAIGEMAVHCGACHVAAGAPVVIAEPPSVIGGSLSLEMGRHQQAVQELWRGLVTPDDAAIYLAAAILQAAPLIPSGPDAPVPSAVATELERGVHELADELSRSEGMARGSRFGQLLTTCATCHQLFR